MLLQYILSTQCSTTADFLLIAYSQYFLKNRSIEMTRNTQAMFRIDFSLRREVLFVVIGAILGAVTMVIPITLLYTGLGLPYYLTWMAFGHVIGVYSPSSSIIAGIAIHLITAIS